MAQKIRKEQIEGNLVVSVTGTGVNNADPRNPIINTPDMSGFVTDSELAGMGFLTSEDDPHGISTIVVTGTDTKTVTITKRNGQTVVGTFTDKDTTYSGVTITELNTGTDATNKLISANILNQYITNRLSSVLVYKGQVQAYANLPTTGNKIGDMYNIVNANSNPQINAGDNVAWNGTTWDVMSGTIDLSAFLTVEVDPTGVASIAVTGTTTKTITITLNNGTTKTTTFADLNTTYTAGTLALLNTGTDTTDRVWSAKNIADYIAGKGFLTAHRTPRRQTVTVTGAMITATVATITLTVAPAGGATGVLIALNGVAQPTGALAVSGTTATITQSFLATPIIAGDELEFIYES